MDTAAEILVIITSAVLILFLLLAIYLSVLAIKLVKRLKHLAERAESVADAVENIGESLKASKSPMAFIRLMRTVAGNKGRRR